MGRKQDNFSDIRPMVYGHALTIGRSESGLEIEQKQARSGGASPPENARGRSSRRPAARVGNGPGQPVYFVTRPATQS